MNAPGPDLAGYRDALGDVGVADALAKLALLQLLPENSHFLFRLETAVQVLIQSPTGDTGRIVTARELERWLGETPVAHEDDPLNNTFADEVVFYGGSYVVLPG